MSRTAAERQRAFRERHIINGDRVRLELIVPVSAAEQIKRLARHRGRTIIALVQEIAGEIEEQTLARMGPAEKRRYRSPLQ